MWGVSGCVWVYLCLDVDQADLKLAALLPRPCECWDCRYASPFSPPKPKFIIKLQLYYIFLSRPVTGLPQLTQKDSFYSHNTLACFYICSCLFTLLSYGQYLYIVYMCKCLMLCKYVRHTYTYINTERDREPYLFCTSRYLDGLK